MSGPEIGGDPPCWAHMLDEPGAGECQDSQTVGALVVDLDGVPAGSGGAIWSLPHGGDLDANLVRLDPGQTIAAHRNDEVDVVLFVRSGTGELTIDDRVRPIGVDHLALIPRGAQRSIDAGPGGIAYLSIHRRRSPLGIEDRKDQER